jgi:hypothetical protein
MGACAGSNKITREGIVGQITKIKLVSIDKQKKL